MFIELEPIFAKHKQYLQKTSLTALFADPNRFSNLSRQETHLLYDFSKQRVSTELLNDCIRFLEKCNFKQHIDKLFAGQFVNITENRKVWHTQLRALNPEAVIKDTLKRMQEFTHNVHTGVYKSASNANFKNVINVGIGGSDLGVRMIHKALHTTQDPLHLHFLANTDRKTLLETLATLNIAQTLCVISSKSFTTPETLLTFKILQKIFHQELGENYRKHFIIITANNHAPEINDFAIDQIFPLWPWVGGRFSVGSAIGLPLALSLGWQQFQEFLHGLQTMDHHFQHTPFINNLPILMSIIGIWNINILNINNLAIIPYGDSLEYFPDYLQQLEMESNGKSCDIHGNKINYVTAPIVWGGIGCNSQHSFFQALHQGTHLSAIDFILPLAEHQDEQQDFLSASCVAQSLALMTGNHFTEHSAINNAKTCLGNKPSSTIIIKYLNSFTLGQLIALYEHKVFVQGLLWNIASFDQWGVELGKTTTKTILEAIQNSRTKLDSSSTGLLKYIGYTNQT